LYLTHSDNDLKIIVNWCTHSISTSYSRLLKSQSKLRLLFYSNWNLYMALNFCLNFLVRYGYYFSSGLTSPLSRIWKRAIAGTLYCH